jgi:chaperonin GroES
MKTRLSLVLITCAVAAVAWAAEQPAPALNAAQIKPLNDRVLVQPVAAESRPAGGIIIPDTAKEKAQEAIVIAVGAGRVLDSGMRSVPSVKSGDLILIGAYAGTEIVLDGVEHLILREDDILAVIE